MSENQKLQTMVDQGGEVLNKQAHNNALWAKQNASLNLLRKLMKKAMPMK